MTKKQISALRMFAKSSFTSSKLRFSNLRKPAAFGEPTSRLWHGIAFCYEDSKASTADFYVYNGNIKEKPAPLKDTT